MEEGFTLAYDADCGPCARFRLLVEFFDTERALEYLSIDEAEASGKLNNVDESLRHRSFHLVSSKGYAWSGAEALAPLTNILHPGGRWVGRVLNKVPAAGRAASFGYAGLARLHENGSCRATR